MKSTHFFESQRLSLEMNLVWTVSMRNIGIGKYSKAEKRETKRMSGLDSDWPSWRSECSTAEVTRSESSQMCRSVLESCVTPQKWIKSDQSANDTR